MPPVMRDVIERRFIWFVSHAKGDVDDFAKIRPAL